MRVTAATLTIVLMLAQLQPATGRDLQPDETRRLIASSGQTRLWVKTSPRPESSDATSSLVRAVRIRMTLQRGEVEARRSQSR